MKKAGLPAEEAEAYLKKGYSLNDRVGTSYLEKQYEETLQGKRSVKKSIWINMAIWKVWIQLRKVVRETISS